jgi:FkbH-like protein
MPQHSTESTPPKDEGSSVGIPSVLSPIALNTKTAAKISLAVLGTCLAESFANLAAASEEFSADHYLVQTGRNDHAAVAEWKNYDAVLVQVTLRQLLDVPSEERNDLSYIRDIPDYDAVLNSTGIDLNDVINRLLDPIGGAVPVFFLSFPEPPATYQGILLNNRKKSIYHFIRTLNDRMAEILESIPHAHYIEINDLMSAYGTAEISDSFYTHFTHAGFRASKATDRMYLNIVERVRNSLAILKSENPVKIIVTDLDNTLWKGVLAELDDFVPHEHYEGWPLGYVEALLEFKRRGGLIAISSKNDQEQTLRRFEKIWQKKLRIDDFCSIKINWDAKSRNILDILAETNLLSSNALFIDDNPHEIQEVEMAIPGIRTLTGDPEAWRSIILYSAETQVAFVSQESKARTELIRAKKERDNLSRNVSRDEFLRSLQIRVKFDCIADSAHPKYERAVELLNKTNQFNTTGKRWGLPDLQTLFSSGGILLALTAEDKFGDSGLVSLAVILGDEIVQIVLSCRVFGLSLESALLWRVLEIIRSKHSYTEVKAQFLDTGKNKTCSAFYPSNGFVEISGSDGYWQSANDVAWPAWIQRAQ